MLVRVLVDGGLRTRLGAVARETVVAVYDVDANTRPLGEILARFVWRDAGGTRPRR